jgi:hypothetical protein
LGNSSNLPLFSYFIIFLLYNSDVAHLLYAISWFYFNWMFRSISSSKLSKFEWFIKVINISFMSPLSAISYLFPFYYHFYCSPTEIQIMFFQYFNTSTF